MNPLGNGSVKKKNAKNLVEKLKVFKLPTVLKNIKSDPSESWPVAP